MTKLDLALHLEDADAFYKSFVQTIDAADEGADVAFLIRLVLILANQVGDQGVLEDAVTEAARAAVAQAAP